MSTKTDSMTITIEAKFKHPKRLAVLSYVYSDQFGVAFMGAETIVYQHPDFSTIHDAVEQMHSVAEKAGGKIENALLTVLPMEKVKEVSK